MRLRKQARTHTRLCKQARSRMRLRKQARTHTRLCKQARSRMRLRKQARTHTWLRTHPRRHLQRHQQALTNMWRAHRPAKALATARLRAETCKSACNGTIACTARGPQAPCSHCAYACVPLCICMRAAVHMHACMHAAEAPCSHCAYACVHACRRGPLQPLCICRGPLQPLCICMRARMCMQIHCLCAQPCYQKHTHTHKSSLACACSCTHTHTHKHGFIHTHGHYTRQESRPTRRGSKQRLTWELPRTALQTGAPRAAPTDGARKAPRRLTPLEPALPRWPPAWRAPPRSHTAAAAGCTAACSRSGTCAQRSMGACALGCACMWTCVHAYQSMYSCILTSWEVCRYYTHLCTCVCTARWHVHVGMRVCVYKPVRK